MKFYSDPVYIEMCRTAEEIQAIIPFDIGDWFYTPHANSVSCNYFDFTEENIAYNKVRHDKRVKTGRQSVWLPRLDQLIEMAMGSGTIQATHNEFQQYEWENPGYKTYEEEWLGFVMEKLHGKRWTGEEWEEI